MSEPDAWSEEFAGAVTMTGVLLAMLAGRPGVTLAFPDDDPGNVIEIEFDSLPGRYRLTVTLVP